MPSSAPQNTAQFTPVEGGASVNRSVNNPADHLYPKKVSDVYKSVNIGLGAKVHFWSHTDTSQNKYLEDGEHADLSAEVPGLTCFSVDPDDSNLVEFTFVDKKPTSQGPHLLTMKVWSVGDVDVPANDHKWHFAGKISGSSGLIQTAIYVREPSGAYVGNGSVLFEWDSANQRVLIHPGGQIPPGLTITPYSALKFTATWGE
ncbi:membrane binding-domain-containing protein [Poronia punctata]|nr:membrane binding-domain-containing protein [Poronia punctata]